MVLSMGQTLAPADGILFDNVFFADGYKPISAYGQFKLANSLYSNELSRAIKVRHSPRMRSTPAGWPPSQVALYPVSLKTRCAVA
jgi:hypothetical protein